MTPDKRDLLVVLNALEDYVRRTRQPRILLSGWTVEDQNLQPPPSLVAKFRQLPLHLGKYAQVARCFEAKAQATALLRRYLTLAGQPITPAQVAVLPSGSNGLLLTLLYLRNQGVRKLYASSPNYFATFEICRQIGLPIEILPAQDFLTCRLDYDRIASTLSAPDTALIVTNPTYSVGVEYGPAALNELCAAIPAHAYVVFDEIYLGLNWGTYATPWYQYDFPPRTILLRSPSKSFLMYGAKLCFMIAPHEAIQHAETLSEFLSSVPGNFEALALAYIQAFLDWDAEIRRQEIGEFRQWKAATIACLTGNLNRLNPWLDRLGLQRSPINSGPYLTVAAPRARFNGFDPVALAGQQGVLCMTSDHYYHDDPGLFGFRLNLCGNCQAFERVLRDLLPASLARR